MWEGVTGTKCLGDTFKVDFTKQKQVVYLKSGQPCPDFSSSHAGGKSPGSSGKTGWQFVAQVEKISQKNPVVFLIEMVANVLQVNDGMEVDTVVEATSQDYVVHQQVLSVAQYGDCSNRKRLFIVGFCKERVGCMANKFEFPQPEFDEHNFYTARDVAVPDDVVPDKYWLHEDVEPFIPYKDPLPLCIHKIGHIKPGMGPSWRPYAVQTFDGIFPTQTTHNGGGRRVPLSWKQGDPIRRARVTVPTEAPRVASLPDDYIDVAAAIDPSDEFRFKAVNIHGYSHAYRGCD